MYILAIVHAVFTFLFGSFLSFHFFREYLQKQNRFPRYMKVPCIRRQAETFI